MKRLNTLQKDYLARLLEIGHDYTSYEDLGYEAQLALTYMRMPNNELEQERLEQLTNKFINKHWKDLKKYNEANR